MDPAGLLISIGTLAVILDGFSESYQSASGTLAMIRAQIRMLEAGATRIQEWLHFTDPTTKSHVMASLTDAIETVNDSLERLREDVAAITQSGPKTTKLLGTTASNQWTKTKFVMGEGRLRKHLTDVRECASLLHFTLNVCQLPVGRTADKELDELSVGAQKLRRAQTLSKRERRATIEQSDLEEGSDDYKSFMTSVLAAEDELPDESPVVSRQSTGETVTPAASVAKTPRDRDELHFTNERADRSSVSSRPMSTWSIPETERRLSLETLEPESPARPQIRSANSALISEITGILDRSTANGIDDDNDVALPPDIPSRNPQRAEKDYSSSIPRRNAPIKRKPVSRSSTYDLSTVTENAERPRQFSAPFSSASRTSLADKMMPLTQSLQSLSSNEYVSVELDQAPVQPYPDGPPAYAAASPPEAAGPSNRRRRTTGSSSRGMFNAPSIIQFARENRLDDISGALKNGYNVNETDPVTATTPIMEAAKYHRLEACRQLLQAGAKVHLRDTEGNTVVHHAAQAGDAEICQLLIDAGAHVEDCNKDGLQPVLLAVAGGHTEAVLCLINASPYKKPNDDILVRSFLESVKLGDTPTAQTLLAKGVKPKKIKDTWRLAGYAAQSGSLPMLELMLNNKASLKDKSPQGYTPLHYAALHGHQPMVEKLLSLKVPWKAQTKKTDETALHMAAACGHSSLALALVAHKDANVTMEDADRQEPIHHAVRKGDLKLTAALIEGGAKLKNANKFGWKPIHLAAAYGHAALLAECMTRGISVEEKLLTPAFKPEKRTNVAARRGYWAEIRWPHAGARPLHLALEFGHDDIASMLISGGAKLDEADSRGWRPLHMAAWSCRPDMVEVLLAKGVTADAKTIDGHTALSLGFREYGMTGDAASRRRIYDLLSVSMARTKKSMLKRLASNMSSAPSESKTANQRNLAWHRAQLAESLYQPGAPDEGETDTLSVSVSADGSEDIGVAVSDEMARLSTADPWPEPQNNSVIALAR